MSTFESIVKWLRLYEMKFGKHPKVIPISAPERMDIVSDYLPYIHNLDYGKDQLLGIDIETFPWAELTRQRILDIGIERLSLDQKMDQSKFTFSQYNNEWNSNLIKRLTTEILTDVTHLDVSFDWDRLAWLKRKVKWIGYRWAVKRKTVRIEGKVLYPYLKIQAPADTHRVRFIVQP